MITDKDVGKAWEVLRGKMRAMGLNIQDQKKMVAALYWCVATEDLATGGCELYGLQLLQDALNNEDKRQPMDWLLAAFAKHEARGIGMDDVKAVCRQHLHDDPAAIDELISQLIRGER